MKRIAFALLILVACGMFVGCASAPSPAVEQIAAAKQALLDAKAENADKLCADEYQSAEMKLRQAELLLQDGENDQAGVVATQTGKLAELAKKCAIARKSQPTQPVVEEVVPDELKNFKASVYFDYNSNTIRVGEREKLDKAIEYLRKMSKDHKFYLLLTSYCDAPGTPGANADLAKRRALVTRFVLSENGLSKNRIYMQALGSKPATSATGEGKTVSRKKDQEWRRVDITVLFTRPTSVVMDTLTKE